MERRKWRWIVSIILFVLVIVLCVVFMSRERIDLERVHPEIASLKEPLRSLTVDYYLDGGSIGISLTDRNGTNLMVAIPAGEGPHEYLGVYLGTNVIDLATRKLSAPTNLPGVIRIDPSKDTELYLQRMLFRNRNLDSTGMTELALAHWRNEPKDKIALAWKALWIRLGWYF